MIFMQSVIDTSAGRHRRRGYEPQASTPDWLECTDDERRDVIVQAERLWKIGLATHYQGNILNWLPKKKGQKASLKTEAGKEERAAKCYEGVFEHFSPSMLKLMSVIKSYKDILPEDDE